MQATGFIQASIRSRSHIKRLQYCDHYKQISTDYGGSVLTFFGVMEAIVQLHKRTFSGMGTGNRSWSNIVRNYENKSINYKSLKIQLD